MNDSVADLEQRIEHERKNESRRLDELIQARAALERAKSSYDAVRKTVAELRWNLVVARRAAASTETPAGIGTRVLYKDGRAATITDYAGTTTAWIAFDGDDYETPVNLFEIVTLKDGE
jgi:hypothetical protein